MTLRKTNPANLKVPTYKTPAEIKALVVEWEQHDPETKLFEAILREQQISFSDFVLGRPDAQNWNEQKFAALVKHYEG